MAGPDRIEWRRGFPYRAWRRLGWYAGLAGLAIVAGYVLFGSEPQRLESGQRNPIALVPAGLAVLGGVGAIPFMLALVRRPIVSADHFALSVRPGTLRTLLLPWARIVEIAAVSARHDRYLLVRCDPQRDRLGDSPRWWDRFVLRAAAGGRRTDRGGAHPAAYDIAVRMTDFVGDPDRQFDELVAFAPEHVRVAGESA